MVWRRATSATADCPWYVAVNEWAEPDEDFAVASLKRLYEDEDYRTQLGRRERKTINEHYSVRNVGDSIRSFLATDDCSA